MITSLLPKKVTYKEFCFIKNPGLKNSSVGKKVPNKGHRMCQVVPRGALVPGDSNQGRGLKLVYTMITIDINTKMENI